ncbi:hypothetical protein BH09MYX1_BH09MYX1_05960 [soil metagenome]
MSTNLRSTIETLASQFVDGILSAMRKAPLEELLEGGGRQTAARPTRPASTPTSSSTPASSASAPRAKRSRAGRLARRSEGELAKALDDIVNLLRRNPKGLRAEQIRDALSVAAKELPRPLSDGLTSGRLRKSGEKRATTYFVGAKAGPSSK